MKFGRIKYKSLLYMSGTIMIAYLTALITVALKYIRVSGFSRDFLMKVNSIPVRSTHIGIIVTAMMLGFVISEYVMETRCVDGKPGLSLYICLLSELVLAAGINYFLLCSASNVIYLIVGNIILIPFNNREKTLYITIASFIYIGIEVNQIFHLYLPYGFNDLFAYLGASGLQMQSVTVFMKTTNCVAFIILCLAALNSTSKEKQQIEDLNHELSQTIDELHVSYAQLKQQTIHDEELAVYKERLRFSRDMHDIIGHVLTGLVVGLKACDALSEGSGKTPLSEHIDKLSVLASNGLNDLRRAINDMRIFAQEAFSLTEEIEKLLSAIEDCSNIHIQRSFTGEDRVQIDSVQETVIYRIIQESVTNAVRHAHTHQMAICIAFDADTHICIENDGDVSESFREGNGLKNMRERIVNIGGQMEVSSVPLAKFVVDIHIPLQRKDNDTDTDR